MTRHARGTIRKSFHGRRIEPPRDKTRLAEMAHNHDHDHGDQLDGDRQALHRLATRIWRPAVAWVSCAREQTSSRASVRLMNTNPRLPEQGRAFEFSSSVLRMSLGRALLSTVTIADTVVRLPMRAPTALATGQRG